MGHHRFIGVASCMLGGACIVSQFLGFGQRSDVLLIASIAAGVVAVCLSAIVWDSQPGMATTALFLGFVSAFAWFFLYFGLWNLYEARDRREATERLERIGQALHQYCADNGRRFPPPALLSNEGKPLLSWRVLILPYLGHNDLHSKFKLSEPWDSAHNVALLPLMPKVYERPEDGFVEHAAGTTFCQVFVGPGTAFDGTSVCLESADFPRSTANTILVAEAGKAVPWTKPEDIVYSPREPLPPLGGLTAAKRAPIFFNTTSSFPILMADGSTRSMSYDHNQSDLAQMITRR